MPTHNNVTRQDERAVLSQSRAVTGHGSPLCRCVKYIHPYPPTTAVRPRHNHDHDCSWLFLLHTPSPAAAAVDAESDSSGSSAPGELPLTPQAS